MRSLWSGALGFGLLRIPVKLYSATKIRPLQFDFLHKNDLSPIGFTRICKKTGEEVSSADLVRGYEYQKDHYVVLQDEDFKRAIPDKAQLITISEFVRPQEIDPKYFVKPYYVGPGEGAEKLSQLFWHALERSGKMAIGKFIFRMREQFIGLKADHHGFMLYTLRFPDQIKPLPEEASPQLAAVNNEAEVDLAVQLIDALTKPFQSEQYHDRTTEQLHQFITEKIQGKLKSRTRARPIASTPIAELIPTLQASLQALQPAQRRLPPKSS